MTGAEMLLGENIENEQEAAPQQQQQKQQLSDAERALRQEVKQLRQERQSANQRAAEAENTARFWHEKAQAAPTVAKKEAIAEEENPADFIEQLTEKGVGAIDALLAKRGYVKESDVEARINQARNQVTVESALARDYPELQDAESEFFKETARQYQHLVSETPELKGNPRTMRLAAKLADAELLEAEEKPVRKAPKREAVQEDDDEEEDDTPARREDARVRRVQSQSVRGRATRREANDDTLDNVQKGIVANLRAAGANITEESLIKRIQGGTKLSGRIGMAAAAMRNKR